MSQNDDEDVLQDDEDTDNIYFDKGIDEVYEDTFGNEPSGEKSLEEEIDKDEEEH